MIKIQYDRNEGIALPDGKVKAWVDYVVYAHKRGNSGQHLVGTDSIINELRLRVALKELTPADIQFVFDNGSTVFLVPIDHDGFFSVTPVGFADYSSMQALELLGAVVGNKEKA